MLRHQRVIFDDYGLPDGDDLLEYLSINYCHLRVTYTDVFDDLQSVCFQVPSDGAAWVNKPLHINVQMTRLRRQFTVA